MFTLDIDKRILKRIAWYAACTIFLIIFDYVYSLFGHGVTSKYMSLAFLYTLIGGVVFYMVFHNIITSVIDEKNTQIFFNFYNSGIATLVVGSILKGIMVIAGTASPYSICYTIVGWALVLLGIGNLINVKFRM